MDEKNNYKVMKDLAGYFKKGERLAIYNAAENPRDKLLIRLLWVTGRRLSEILNIKISDINFEDRHVIINVLKKRENHQDISYLDEDTIRIINIYLNNNDLIKSDYLFRSDFNPQKPISRQRAFNIIKKCCNDAGIYKVGNKEPHPHHFRHTYAIDQARKLKSPADLRKLQMALSHSNLGVTEQYLKFAAEDMKTMVQNVDY